MPAISNEPGTLDSIWLTIASSSGVDKLIGWTRALPSALDTYSSNIVRLFGVGP